MDDEAILLWQEMLGNQPLLDSLFHGLDEDALSMLESLTEREAFMGGACVFKEGSSGDSMYVVATGQFRVSKTDPLGNEIELRVIGSGEVFGEIALLEQVSRTATVSAITDATAFRLDRDGLQRNPDLTTKIYGNLARILARRLRQSTDEILLLETWVRLGENE